MELKTTGALTTIQTSFAWKISDLNKHWNCKPGEAIKSPTFTIQTSNSNKKWNMLLFFSGDCDQNKQFVSLYLQPQCNMCEEKQLCLSILNKQKQKVWEILFDERFLLTKDKARWGCSKFISKYALSHMADQFIPNTLTILCEVVVSYTEKESEMHYQGKKLHTDVGTLLENGIFSDLILTVDGKYFTTHKNILTARSTTFKQWFKNKNINPEQGSFKIDEFSCRVFTKILQFIYTGKGDFLASEAADILRAATSYGLDDLKFLCEEVLSKNLSLGNVVTTFMIADLYDAKSLKKSSMNFIISNAREVLDIPEYKNMAEEYPRLLREIYEETILRR